MFKAGPLSTDILEMQIVAISWNLSSSMALFTSGIRNVIEKYISIESEINHQLKFCRDLILKINFESGSQKAGTHYALGITCRWHV